MEGHQPTLLTIAFIHHQIPPLPPTLQEMRESGELAEALKA
jgi:hypothetical protein